MCGLERKSRGYLNVNVVDVDGRFYYIFSKFEHGVCACTVPALETVASIVMGTVAVVLDACVIDVVNILPEVAVSVPVIM
jgi:hypothetical protein